MQAVDVWGSAGSVGSVVSSGTAGSEGSTAVADGAGLAGSNGFEGSFDTWPGSRGALGSPGIVPADVSVPGVVSSSELGPEHASKTGARRMPPKAVDLRRLRRRGGLELP